jgi:hypothetical protein
VQLVNIYVPATRQHLAALLLAAATATRRRQLATAEQQLRGAVRLLGCCRCLPTDAVAAHAALARVLRLQAALQLPAVQPAPATKGSSAGSAPLSGAPLQQQRLQEAARLLVLALQVHVSDGSCDPITARSLLLELASAWVQCVHHMATAGCSSTAASAGARTAAALAAAQHASAHMCALLLGSPALQPLASLRSALPGWLLEQLQGQEQLQASRQQAAAAAAAAQAAVGGHKQPHVVPATTVEAGAGASAPAVQLPDATLGRLAVCAYTQQLAAAACGAAGLHQQQLAAEQLLQLGPALRLACAKFADSCCCVEVPADVRAGLAGGPLPALQPGQCVRLAGAVRKRGAARVLTHLQS